MYLIAFPLLLIPFALYNMIIFLLNMPVTDTVFVIPLAAVLPNPRRRSAKQPGPAVRRLAAIYADRAVAQAPLAACAKPTR